MSTTADRRLARHFERLIAHRRLVLTIALVCTVAATAGLHRLVKDTSVDAFIPQDHPSIQADRKVADVFGLGDPIAVAVSRTDTTSIFTPEDLRVIEGLTEDIAALPHVREDRVTSLATESAIHGADGTLMVDAYIDGFHRTLEDARKARQLWHRMPPHEGTLVADDASGAVILAELAPGQSAAEGYEAILELAAAYERPGVEIMVAGPAAVSGLLSQRIDEDARVLQPLVFLVVLVFLYLAFHRLAALLGPLVLTAGAAGGALGLMAWQNVPYFAITNALPVVIVAIAVADAIHILSAYYRLRAGEPEISRQETVVRAMCQMARPITLTTLTTMAGFVGIAAVSIMPPISYFAWYAALGVALAWAFSMFVLPGLLASLPLGTSAAFRSWEDHRPDRLGRWMGRVGAVSARRYVTVLTVFTAIVAVALAGALHLRIDRSQVENFPEDEPIRIADERINTDFAGTAFLDVIIESDAPGGMLEDGRMQRVAELQRHFESLPHVEQTVSIADYLSLMHTAITESPVTAGRPLPSNEDALAQYLLVYEASGDPSDLDEEITPDYDAALVRGILDTPYFSESVATVEALQEYLDRTFDEPGLTATLAGDVNSTYHWMTRLERSHFTGVTLSLCLVLAMSIAVFRSPGAGVVAVIPVAFTVLVIYAVMGYLGIYLEPATSMFAAISVGVGVDFAIHLVDRLRTALRTYQGDMNQAIEAAMPLTSRACFFNAAALGVGFASLLASELPTLQRFGGLVAVAVLASFLASLVIVPASYACLQTISRRWPAGLGRELVRRSSLMLFVAAIGLLDATETAADAPTGREIAERVAERPEAPFALRRIDMTLTDRRDRTRERQALVVRRNADDLRQTRITYLAPKAVREVSFLSHDYRAAKRSDDRWLYLPAARKVRRIPASNRGDYFLGTDFTYEDMQSDLRFELADYRFRYEGGSLRGSEPVHTITGQPVSPKVARELGYGAFRAVIAEASWMPLEIHFDDPDGEALKTIRIHEMETVEGYWTALRIEARNHQTGHTTMFEISEVSYPEQISARTFLPASLPRGVPEI